MVISEIRSLLLSMRSESLNNLGMSQADLADI